MTPPPSSNAQPRTVAAIRAQNTQDAVAADAMGAPAYVLNGEPFWGQDRIEYLERALATGRAPFAAAPSRAERGRKNVALWTTRQAGIYS